MEVQDAPIFCINMGIDFCAMWAPSWGPSWRHVWPFWPTRRTQGPSKKTSKLSPKPSDGSKRVPDPSGTLPDLDSGAPELRCSTDLGAFWVLVDIHFPICLSFIIFPDYGTAGVLRGLVVLHFNFFPIFIPFIVIFTRQEVLIAKILTELKIKVLAIPIDDLHPRA